MKNNEREIKIMKMVAAMMTAGEREFRIIWVFVSTFLHIEE